MNSLPTFIIFTALSFMGCRSCDAMEDQTNIASPATIDSKRPYLRRAVQEEVFYEDVPDVSDSDIKSVMEWISAEVGMVKNPFCWKDSYGRGVGTFPGRVADCPSGYTNHGLTCFRGSDDILAPSRVADCPSGYTNMGYTCFRGVHSIHTPSRVADCPSGYTNTGLTCHKWWPPHTLSGGPSRFTCPSGYFKSSISHRCHKNCPSGYRSDGEFCTRHAHSLGMSSMTCPAGYFQSKATARCHKNCPSGYTNTGETCHRPVSIKGLESMTCKEGERSYLSGARCYPPTGVCFDNKEEDDGLCYRRCRDGFHGIGPVCWGVCDNSMVNCAAACAKSSEECALGIFDQAVSTLVLAANVATLGLATPATAGATATIRVGGKTVAGTSKVGKALVSAVSKLQTIKPGNLETGASVVKRVINARTGTKLREIGTKAKIGDAVYNAMKQYRETFADDFGEQTSPEIEEELDSHFHPTTARFFKELWAERMINDLAEANAWQLASTTLAAASIIDITGVTGVVSAYAKPVCSKIVHFPCTSADLKCNGGSGGDGNEGNEGNGDDGGSTEKEPIRFRSTTNNDGKVTEPTYIQVSGGGWNKVHCAITSRVLEDGESFTVRGNKLQAGVGLCIDSKELQDGGKCGIRFNHNCVGFYGDNRNLMFAADESGKEYKISADNNMSTIQGITYNKEGHCVRHASSRTQQCVPLPEHFMDKPLRATAQVWNSARATIV